MEQKILERTKLAVEDWQVDGTWSVYKFNFNGAAWPAIEEVNDLKGVTISFRQVDHFLLYLFSESSLAGHEETCEAYFAEDCLLLNLSTTNSGHSLSEFISFFNFYLAEKSYCNIVVSSLVIKSLPLVAGILMALLPKEKLIVLDADRRYFFKKLAVRRNTHFNSIVNWKAISYAEVGDRLEFNSLQSTVDDYHDNPRFLLDLSERLYNDNKEKYPVFDIVMLAKIDAAENMTTPGRAMKLDLERRRRLEAAGIKILSISDFESTAHYISTLRGARKFITSYGNVACTNRFFLNPDGEVLLLANRQYQWEYEHPGDGSGEHWHLRHSHLFPVAHQTVLLNHNDVIDDNDVERIIGFALRD